MIQIKFHDWPVSQFSFIGMHLPFWPSARLGHKQKSDEVWKALLHLYIGKPKPLFS